MSRLTNGMAADLRLALERLCCRDPGGWIQIFPRFSQPNARHHILMAGPSGFMKAYEPERRVP
jgi:hypothetical protein